jgi:hypothetical protein
MAAGQERRGFSFGNPNAMAALAPHERRGFSFGNPNAMAALAPHDAAAGQERRGFSFGNPNASDRSARDSAHQIERRGDLDLWELDPGELASAAEGLELPDDLVDRSDEQQILSPRILNTRARQYRFWPEKIS